MLSHFAMRFSKGFFILMIVVGLLFAAVGGFGIYRYSQGTYGTTEARVVNVILEYDPVDPDEVERHEIYADYTVDGTDYKNILLTSADSSVRLGDKITVEYDLNDPSSAQIKGGESTLYVVTAAGLVIAVASGLLLKKKQEDEQNFSGVDD